MLWLLQNQSNMSVHCGADVVSILNLVDVEICHYDTSHIDKIKEILPRSKTLSISCKKFGISKVHEIFFSKEQSQKILWKMNSEDSKYTNAAFIIKSKAHLALLQENNSDDENTQSNDASESELGEEDPVECNEESDVDKFSVAPEVPLVTKSTDSVVLEELSFEDVTVNSWVLVLYEGEKFLGGCLSKINGKF